jgi:hypothetical protein
MQNTQSQVKNGSSDTELAFEAEIVEELIISSKNEIALWMGDTKRFIKLKPI